jgi:hypothetical protein
MPASSLPTGVERQQDAPLFPPTEKYRKSLVVLSVGGGMLAA